MIWDKYFYNICGIISTKSPCLSRKIGAIIVKDKSIVSTGYNGPPRGIPHCGKDRVTYDHNLVEALNLPSEYPPELEKTCPRKLLGYKSGTGMKWCPAQHAEENAISNAARLGVSVIGATLYMNSVIPCQKCFGTLINAGIVEVVIEDDTFYDDYTSYLLNHSTIKVRTFNYES